MSIERAQNALNELAAISAARFRWIQDAQHVAERFHGWQGVSTDSQFVAIVTKLFDDHVRHLIEREKWRVEISLETAFPTKDSA